MSNFDELLNAINEEKTTTPVPSSYEDQTKQISEVLNKVVNTIKNLPGDKFDGKIDIEDRDMVVVKVTVISVDGEPVICFLDGVAGLKVDLNPTNHNRENLVSIENEDAKSLRTIVKSIKDCHNASNNDLEETLMGVMANAIKTLKGTASEPYKNLRTFWAMDHLFISDGQKSLGVFCFNRDTVRGSDEIMKGPEALKTLSDECSRVLRQGFETIKAIGKNEHDDSDGLEAACKMLDRLPNELRLDLLKTMRGAFKH